MKKSWTPPDGRSFVFIYQSAVKLAVMLVLGSSAVLAGALRSTFCSVGIIVQLDTKRDKSRSSCGGAFMTQN